MATEKQLAEILGAAVTGVLSQLKGAEFDFSIPAVPGPEADLETVELVFKGSPLPILVISFGTDFLRAAAGALLGQDVTGEELASDISEAAEEFWRQVIGRANTSLPELLAGRELEVVGIKKPEWRASSSLYLSIAHEKATVYTMLLGLAPELMVLFPAEKPADRPARNVETAADEPVSEKSLSSTEGQQLAGVGRGRECDHENLDLLLDIPLAVTLRFGERTLALRDILQLSSGAVIELDQRAEEPVDLCLENRVIARGQVVVVDGCYGLRVLQICRPAAGLIDKRLRA